MKELIRFANDLVDLAGWLFAFAVFGSISVVAYHFYPKATAAVLALTATGWIMDFFKRRKSPKNG